MSAIHNHQILCKTLNFNKRIFLLMDQTLTLDQIQPSEELFISQETGYILIKAMQYRPSFKVPPIYMFYENDDTSIGELITRYKEKLSVEDPSILQQTILVKLEDVGLLSLSMTIKKLKAELNNQNIKRLQLKPLTLQQAKYQITDELAYRNSKYFLPFQKVLFCFKLPQFSLNVYAKLKMNIRLQQKTVFSVLVYLLKTNTQFQVVREYLEPEKLNPEDVQLTCLTSNQSINLLNTVESELKLKKKLVVKFHKLKNNVFSNLQRIEVQIHKSIYMFNESLVTIGTFQTNQEKQQQTQRQSMSMRNNSKISKINLRDVLGYKVSTLLEECGVEKAFNYGLSILGKLLTPNDLIDKILEAAQNVLEGPIQAYLVYDFQFFYRLFRHIPQPLRLVQITHLKTKHYSLIQKYYEQFQERFVESMLQFKQAQYLLLYTTDFVYKQLNKYIRQDLQIFNPQVQEVFQQWQFKLTHLLIKILKKIPNYHGTVYRFSRQPEHFAVGQVIHFKFFVSTSCFYDQAKKFSARGTCCYIIQSMTGKEISQYSRYNQQKEVLFMPFTHFVVLSVEHNGEFTIIRMKEIPTAKKINSSILLWVDDNSKQGSFIFNKIFIEHPHINLQIINLTDNHTFKIWVEKFGCLMFNKKRKVILVTNMYRTINGEKKAEGIQTIKIIRQYLPEIQIFVYVSNVSKTLETLVRAGYVQNNLLRVSRDPDEVKKFIQSHTIRNDQMESNVCNNDNYGCQLI